MILIMYKTLSYNFSYCIAISQIVGDIKVVKGERIEHFEVQSEGVLKTKVQGTVFEVFDKKQISFIYAVILFSKKKNLLLGFLNLLNVVHMIAH